MLKSIATRLCSDREAAHVLRVAAVVATTAFMSACSSGSTGTSAPGDSSALAPSVIATPSTPNAPFEWPEYPIGETFTLGKGVKCRVDRVRYGPERDRNQKLKIKIWQQNNSSEPSDGCMPYKYIDVKGQQWDMMACLSPQTVSRGTRSYYTNYVHKCTFPAGTQIAEVYFKTFSAAAAGRGPHAIVTL